MSLKFHREILQFLRFFLSLIKVFRNREWKALPDSTQPCTITIKVWPLEAFQRHENNYLNPSPTEPVATILFSSFFIHN